MKFNLKGILVAVAGILLFVSCASQKEETMPELIDRVFALAKEKYTAMDACLSETELPQSFENGELVKSDNLWWCSGFYPGALWYIYKYTGDESMKEIAHRNTMKDYGIWDLLDNHDLGFQLYCSFGNGYLFTGNEEYLEPLRLGAAKLASRFSEKTGLIRSWDFVKPGCDWSYPVIIDNMMNLEYLMAEGKALNIPEYRDICLSHADLTLANHFRPDWSCYHLVDYDINDGHIRGKQTVQGYGDETVWARGQSWALYGFTMMYRESSVETYLAAAENIARYMISRLPEDGVPFWDYDDPKIPDTNKESSSASIMASALIELSTLTADKELAECCLATAERQLRTLASDAFLSKLGENGNFLLMHGVGSIPEQLEVDVPLTYGDYYFLEALYRYSCLNK